MAFAGADGRALSLATDGLALTPDGDTLYFMYRPLSGSRVLYRIDTGLLRDPAAPPERLVEALRAAGPAPVSDGFELGSDGRLYLTDLEHGAIAHALPGDAFEPVIADPRLSWPDSVGFGPGGDLFITVARFHLVGRHQAAPDGIPFAVYRVRGLLLGSQ